MHALRFLALAALLVACDSPADPDAGSPDPDSGRADAGPLADSGPVPDGGAANDAGTPATDAGTPTCGTAQPSIASIRGTEGLVIARDGTMYFSQRGGVGRMTPDGTVEASWARVGGVTATVWGLALDAANATLFVGVPGSGVHAIDLAPAIPAPELIVVGGSPNGLTMGPDGMLYFSDFAEGHVYRVGPAGGAPTVVTATPIPGANGLAFEAAGTLLAASYRDGQLFRLTLGAGGSEIGREAVPVALANPDGVALDSTGRIYVTDQGSGEVLRFASDGSGRETLGSASAPANLEFGTGALRCNDLYVTSGGGALLRIETDATGGSVPWH